MNLKDIANKNQVSQETSDEDIEKLKNAVAVDSTVQGSFYFISGCVYTFMKINGYEQIEPDDLFKRLKDMKGLTKEQLEESDDPLKKFLLFYFYDES